MNRDKIASIKLNFETYPERWKSFGADLVDAGSPNPCNRSPIARKVLCGRWQEAYQDWLKAGEFSRESEEMMLAFILATEVALFNRAPAAIPTDLPRRVWDEAEFQKCLNRFNDVDFWNKCLGHLTRKTAESTPGKLLENKIGDLLVENKPEEAETFFQENEMDQSDMAESMLALIKTCAHEKGVSAEKKRAQETIWFYADANGRRSQPISEADLKGLFDRGDLPRTTRVWTEGMKVWEQAIFLPAFRTQSSYKGALPPDLS